MRGDDTQQSTMFSYLSPEKRVPASHPLRPIRILVDRILLRLNRRFEEMYAATGRPSIAPEKLLRALWLQILYGAERADADGTVGLQSAVPLVRLDGCVQEGTQWCIVL
jgi:hypothetical protein